MDNEILLRLTFLLERVKNSQEFATLLPILLGGLLIFGLLNCILGYRLLRFWMMLGGFGLGGILGGGLAWYMDGGKLAMAAAAGIGALLLAFLAFGIYRFGIFVVCCCAGWVFSIYILHPTSSLTFFLCLLLGVGLGMAGLRFARPIIIVGTGLQGGFLAGYAAAGLAGLSSFPYGLVFGLGFSMLGITLQFFMNPDQTPARKSKTVSSKDGTRQASKEEDWEEELTPSDWDYEEEMEVYEEEEPEKTKVIRTKQRRR